MRRLSNSASTAIAAIAVMMLVTLMPCAHAAQEVHGTSDAFAGHGVAIAWGVLRGASEETTMIVMRIVGDAGRFARVGAEGVDPFTKERKPVAAPRVLNGVIDVRISRKQFADFPRTEFLFFFSPQSAPGAPPDLVVYYLGVPDTTPEFPAEAALDAYLNDRIAKLRAGGAK
jgi:hypothetical protein